MAAQQRQPKTALEKIRPPLLKVYGAQCVIVLLASVVVVPFNWVASYSLLIGGLISVVPNAYFARQVFRYTGGLYAREVSQSFYRGEAGKFVATLCFFAAVFALVKPINTLVLFVAYVVMTLLNTLLLAGTKGRD
jgi:ATP synthase protein I